jgi:hypothetical protein
MHKLYLMFWASIDSSQIPKQAEIRRAFRFKVTGVATWAPSIKPGGQVSAGNDMAPGEKC